jgi:hypothetical protein
MSHAAAFFATLVALCAPLFAAPVSVDLATMLQATKKMRTAEELSEILDHAAAAANAISGQPEAAASSSGAGWVDVELLSHNVPPLEQIPFAAIAAAIVGGVLLIYTQVVLVRAYRRYHGTDGPTVQLPLDRRLQLQREAAHRAECN